MCGIAGKISFNSHPVVARDLQNMLRSIAHRGPDDEGVFICANRQVGLVNCRLAIIDLSSSGHQPMTYKELTITYNGEIYNYQSLRQKLVKSGVRFHSHTDTEVILALYSKYGPACLKHLRGMFAFAIYDYKRQQVFLARDRLGKKPLKYFQSASSFVFASELKALLTQPEIHREVDWTAINYYLTLGYCPAPLTGFKNVYKLEPGHYLLIDLNTRKIINKKYWQLDYSTKLRLSESEWTTEILKELDVATRLRMIADVPIGVFLSGGIDSSIVTALMAKNSSAPIKTFTIGFRETKYDETKYAKLVAKTFHTDHTVLTVDPQAVDILPQLVASYEEPYADSSAVITYLISRLARRKVKVILNGDGGDENFAGYLRHVKLERDYWLDQHKLIPFTAAASGFLHPRLKRFGQHQQLDIRIRYLDYNSFFPPSDNRTSDLWLKKCREANTSDVRDQLLYTDLAYYFPDDLLAKVDIASMSVGLEARSPFTDYKVVELAAKIPYELKVKHGQTKYILKSVARTLIPNLNVDRPKMGFSIPLSQWFTGNLNSYASSHLLSARSIALELFDKQLIKDMLNRHSLKNDFGPKLWLLLTLQLWWQHYFNT